MMQPRLTLVTLGVADLPKSRAFYEAWGWKASSASQPSVAFFQANGLALGLFGRADLAKDAGVEDKPTGFAAITLAYNAHSKQEADEVYARAIAAGARAVKGAGGRVLCLHGLGDVVRQGAPGPGAAAVPPEDRHPGEADGRRDKGRLPDR